MWDKYSQNGAPRSDIGRIIRIALFAVIGIIIFTIISNQSVNLYLNVAEFGPVFTKPLYYSILSGIVLSSISLVRVNFQARHSMTWYLLKMIIRFLKRTDYESSSSEHSRLIKYSSFRMGKVSFPIWQVTKVLLFAPLFGNLLFGLTVDFVLKGNDLNLGSLGNIFSVPFDDIPMDGSYAMEKIIPMLPALTLLVPPLLAAIGLRLFLFVGISGGINIVSQYVVDSSESKPRFLSYISKVELIIGTAIFWVGFMMFFSSGIDYNTRYAISGTLAIALAFFGYSIIDRRLSRIIIYPTRRHLYSRILTIGSVIVVVGASMAINNSIADAQKPEWLGPYRAQEIAVNRYLADLNDISVVNYDVKPPSVSPSMVQSLVNENKDTLNRIRIWDKEASQSKLLPELGQRNDINFAGFDTLRFGDNIYWAGSTTPSLPKDVTAQDRWFNQHLVYTHSNKGILMLEADTGNVVDESQFFKQKRIYYGESGSSGLFKDSWAAFPLGRTSSQEIDGYYYNGTGGVDLLPPLSWIFEPNFMVSYTTTPIHVMRYKDVNERTKLLYPYFVFDFGYGDTPSTSSLNQIDAIPVTDGANTQWLVPLITAIDTSHVPWAGPFMLKHVGYALVDSYNGSVSTIVTGKDYFSKMFLSEYRSEGATTQVPGWLADQIRYPQEMFIWKIAKFNVYHVTDPKTFIEAKQFYDFPRDVSPYYIITKPQGFEQPEFVGFQSLELRNSPAKNLVGYMIVENNVAKLGNMTFYSVPIDSTTKLLGPSAVKEALDKDKEYLQLKTLLKSSRAGENILYRIGDQEVYYIPVYTSSGSGVVSQLGTIATVGATVSGTYYVGLGDSPSQAFNNYLLKVSGLAPVEQPVDNNQTTSLTKEQRIERIERIFTDSGLVLVRPTAISAPVEFNEASARYLIESDFVATETAIVKFVNEFKADSGGRVFEWQSGKAMNFGVLKQANGIIENHYVSVTVEAG